MAVIGIRREDKSRFERRAALAPEHVRKAISDAGIDVVVEPSDLRIHGDAAYAAAGATVSADLSRASLIMGVKEIPLDKLLADKAYIYFSHTAKGQEHNMPMLQRILDLRCTLLDYEKIAGPQGRLVFFGYHAGLAGMIDGLWIFGKRLAEDGLVTPLASVRQAFDYDGLTEACEAIKAAGRQLSREGFPGGLPPVVFGFAGYGNVSRGAQFVFDQLPFDTVEPQELARLFEPGAVAATDRFYKVVFREEHLARRTADGGFELQEYYDHPERYTGIFEQWLPYLTGLVNCIYWEPRYPKLVTCSEIRSLHARESLRLRMIADITCDIDGSIEMTVEATDQDRPILTFDPATNRVERKVTGPGVSVLAVDNLPCELSKDATAHFGASLGAL